MTDGVTVTPLSAGLLQNTSSVMNRLRHIVLNQKLSCKFKKWFKFSSHVTANKCITRPELPGTTPRSYITNINVWTVLFSPTDLRL
jgi:hypothetical protein